MQMFGPPKPVSEIMFNKFDADKSGSISTKEFAHLCFNLGYALTQQEVDLALKTLDSDGSGTLELKEFTTWWKQGDRWAQIQLSGDELAKRQAAADCFNSFDADKTGSIAKGEFEKFYNALVEAKLTTKPKEKVFEFLDASGDGKVQFAEYIAWLHNTGTLTVALPQK